MSENQLTQMKEVILDATIEEFNQNGLKFTMDDIAKRLGMSKKTLYKVFATKEQMFFAMVDYSFAAIKESERRVLADTTLDIVEKIKKLIVVLPEKYESIDLRQLWHLQEHFPEVYKQVAARIESDWEPTIALIEEGIRQGKIRPFSYVVLKSMVEATIEHFLREPVLIEAGLSYPEALKEMMDLLMYGMKAK